MKAVHFGAGNIGRGFIGLLLFQSGYETSFVDVNEEVVNLLNEKQQYTVKLASTFGEEITVKNVYGINSIQHPEQVNATIAKADIVTAAVGASILPLISGLLTEGLKQRLKESKTPLTIIACENMIGGGDFLKENVYKGLSDNEREAFDKHFSFPNAAVDRIVPNQTNADKLAVTVEPFYEWVVDASQISGEPPFVDGLTYVNNLAPYIERKLFTVNTGHAVAAYTGYLKGIHNLHEALQHPNVQTIVAGALHETGRYLVNAYRFDEQEHQAYIEKIIRRFENPFISDDTTRVARSPKRKLLPNDRLVRPATQYVKQFGEMPVYLVKAIAAALRYDFAGDSEAVEVQQMISELGARGAIERLTGLQLGTELFEAVLNEYENLNIWIS